jgi:hypothetical protein
MRSERGPAPCGLLLALSLAGCGGGLSSTAATDAGFDDASGGAAISGSSGGGSASGGSNGGSGSGSSGSGFGSSSSSSGGADAGSSGSSSGGTGATGQPCSGASCNAGDTCVAIGGVSQCEACGQPGQPCCTTMPACANAMDSCRFSGSLQYCLNNSSGTAGQPGDGCVPSPGSALVCVDSTHTCVSNGMTSYCIVCGGLGNPCCGTTCGTGLACTAGTCQGETHSSGGSSGSGSGGGSSGGGSECQTPDDCTTVLGALPSFCTECSDGGQGCEHYVCSSGVCQTTFCGVQLASSASECQAASDCETLLGPLPSFR